MSEAITILSLATEKESSDGVKKYLFSLHDKSLIESVLIPNKKRTTLCLSTQAGCALGCTFCATGTMGLRRNLSSKEIVAQYLNIAEREKEKCNNENRPLKNIVFMGMGEPFHNYENLCSALDTLITEHGFHSGILTVSTIGIANKIVDFGKRYPLVRLAVSLHTPYDKQRLEIIPNNKRWTLGDIHQACSEYNQITGKEIFFEYVLMDSINDSPEHARDLGKWLEGLACRVNLIPMHPGPENPFSPTGWQQAQSFREELHQHFSGTITFRTSRGLDIEAACGQLVTQTKESPKSENFLGFADKLGHDRLVEEKA
ncbi:MAG: 23S rRNA (adenine(2503)-C(2))-methyltransferase RlmN [Myxococcales bacterium]|nr:23S rRNA (adenine(2503)-C(2))-methyltransferase RlmN [Myxococcales bacterium]